MPAQAPSISTKKSKRSAGVPYQRENGTVYIGSAAAHRLVEAGIAVVDKTKKCFAIRQRIKPVRPDGKRFVVNERWGDKFKSFALVNPETNKVIASVHEGDRRASFGIGAWLRVDSKI